MALYQVSSGQGARSLDLDQYFQMLNGQMFDQAATLGGGAVVLGGNLSIKKLVSPTIASYTLTGATGATTLQYAVVATDQYGTDALIGPTFTITNAPPSLTTSNYVTLFWPPASGGAQYKVLKWNSGTSQWQLLGTVTGVQGQTSNYNFLDQGASPSAYTLALVSPGGQLQNDPIYDSGYLTAPGNFTIPSLPSGWSTLEIDGLFRSSASAATDYIWLHFNNDSSTNYHSVLVVNGGPQYFLSSTQAYVTAVAAASAPSGILDHVRLIIMGFSTAGTAARTWSSFGGNVGAFTTGNLVAINGHGVWYNSAVVTSIQFLTAGGGSFATGSRLVARLLP